jgi:hypothetical protein
VTPIRVAQNLCITSSVLVHSITFLVKINPVLIKVVMRILKVMKIYRTALVIRQNNLGFLEQIVDSNNRINKLCNPNEARNS